MNKYKIIKIKKKFRKKMIVLFIINYKFSKIYQYKMKFLLIKRN